MHVAELPKGCNHGIATVVAEVHCLLAEESGRIVLSPSVSDLGLLPYHPYANAEYHSPGTVGIQTGTPPQGA